MHLWEILLQLSINSIAHTSARPSEGNVILFNRNGSETPVTLAHTLRVSSGLGAPGCLYTASLYSHGDQGSGGQADHPAL